MPVLAILSQLICNSKLGVRDRIRAGTLPSLAIISQVNYSARLRARVRVIAFRDRFRAPSLPFPSSLR